MTVRVKALPEPDQDIIAELLVGFADPEGRRQHLSTAQLAAVELAKAEAAQGKFVPPEQMDALRRRFGP